MNGLTLTGQGGTLFNYRNWYTFTLPLTVVSDITGFYENIDLDKLLSDLRQIAGNCPEIDLLRKCLRKWSVRGDKGIPQGYSASDILAKVYSNSIDMALKNEGFIHLRYVDDTRIFCKTRTDAKRAIVHLSLHVHQKGLNLQSAKTKILTIDQATFEFDGVTKVIKGIQDEIISKIKQDLMHLGPYDDPEDVGLLLQMQKELPPEVIEIAFDDNFSSAKSAEFNKTLFHYLLNRLAQAKSSYAVSYCLEAIREFAEETDFILTYFSKVSLQTTELDKLVAYISSTSAIYDYQIYLVIKWMWQNKIENGALLTFCRIILKDQNRDQWLRSYAVAYLGKYGNQKDYDSIELMYSKSESIIGKADCIIGMYRVEAGKRNAFYLAVQDDDPLINRAVKLAKKL